MRRLIALAGVFAAFFSGTASAQEDPQVSDGQWSYYDIASLKEGDWVQYEAEAGGQKSASYKSACVKIDGNTVWIESDQFLAGSNPGMIELFAVDKTTRKVTKAYMGKPGEVAKELKVTAAPADMETPRMDPSIKMSGVGKCTKDKLTVKGKEFDCQKCEQTLTMKYGEMPETVTKTTTWVSEQVPFKSYVPKEGEKKMKPPYEIKWDTEPSGSGALVKSETEMSGTKSTMSLVGWGTDAKMTVKLK